MAAEIQKDKVGGSRFEILEKDPEIPTVVANPARPADFSPPITGSQEPVVDLGKSSQIPSKEIIENPFNIGSSNSSSLNGQFLGKSKKNQILKKKAQTIPKSILKNSTNAIEPTSSIKFYPTVSLGKENATPFSQAIVDATPTLPIPNPPQVLSRPSSPSPTDHESLNPQPDSPLNSPREDSQCGAFDGGTLPGGDRPTEPQIGSGNPLMDDGYMDITRVSDNSEIAQ